MIEITTRMKPQRIDTQACKTGFKNKNSSRIHSAKQMQANQGHIFLRIAKRRLDISAKVQEKLDCPQFTLYRPCIRNRTKTYILIIL